MPALVLADRHQQLLPQTYQAAVEKAISAVTASCNSSAHAAAYPVQRLVGHELYSRLSAQTTGTIVLSCVASVHAAKTVAPPASPAFPGPAFQVPAFSFGAAQLQQQQKQKQTAEALLERLGSTKPTYVDARRGMLGSYTVRRSLLAAGTTGSASTATTVLMAA